MSARKGERWWGWGEGGGHEPGAEALALLREEIGPSEAWDPPESIGSIELPDPEPLPAGLGQLGKRLQPSVGVADRIRHAGGKGFVDLARMRLGELEHAPDAVFRPADAAAVAALLEACAAEDVAVIPYGGGTSVVGGVEALRGEHRAAISLDLERLQGVEIDQRSLTARLGAGLTGPRAEQALGKAGLTLGHFPQSYEYATIGGYAATRSAGQASTGYGRFDRVVTEARLIAPAGELVGGGAAAHTAAGPSLRELILGSEGTLGVISEVGVRVRRKPRESRYEGWFCESFEAGRDLCRELLQAGLAPDVLRLSDEDETRVSMALSGMGRRTRSVLGRYLKLRGVAGGCVLILGFEGERDTVSRRRSAVAARLRAAGCAYLGRRPGRSWLAGRFGGPYLRDALMDRGVLVETLETAHSWSRLGELYDGVGDALREAMRERGAPGLAFCHLSHAYPDGASLYFTFLCRARQRDPIGQWRAIKRAATEAIVEAGGTITHHHAVGTDHREWMVDEVGELGLDVLRAAKNRLDPTGILNPGKLLPEPR